MESEKTWIIILRLLCGVHKIGKEEVKMQNYKENCLVSDNNSVMEIAIMSVLGDREDQQDCFGYELRADEGVIVVCDGMGGHQGGQKASQTAVELILQKYTGVLQKEDDLGFLLEATKEANEAVCNLQDTEGNQLNAGSTVVSVIVRDNQLCWSSVGDSRAYLYRKGEFVQITQDHNYKTVLDEKKSMGLITSEEYDAECVKGEALISYLGVGKITLVDHNNEALQLMQDDKIVIMSDGLYKLVSDEEIQRIIENFSNITEALQALNMKAKKNARSRQAVRDNMTIAIIKMK